MLLLFYFLYILFSFVNSFLIILHVFFCLLIVLFYRHNFVQNNIISAETSTVAHSWLFLNLNNINGIQLE